MKERPKLLNSESMDLENIVPSIQYVVGKRCSPAWHLSDDKLPFHNLMLVVEGEAYISCGSEEKYHIATAGCMIYIPRGVSRKAYTNAENPMCCYAVNFQYAICQRKGEHWYFDEEPPELPIETIVSVRNMENVISLFKEMNREWQGRKSGHALKCRILLMDILYSILRESRFCRLDSARLKKVEKVMNYIAEHHDEVISLKQMADMAGFSPNYFGSIFKRYSGYTPKEY